MQLHDLKQLGSAATTATLPVQLSQIITRQTASGKPFIDLEVADATDCIRLKVWSDTDAFEFCQTAQAGEICALDGEFYINDFGVNITRPSLSYLDDSEIESFLQGSPERSRELEAHWNYITDLFENLSDPRLKLLTTTVLIDLADKWKRAGAARSYHHARRGGLLEHTAQMLKVSQVLAPQYPEVWPDLLHTGVLFHDIGKCWENDYPASGFTARATRMGELLGHITIGVEVVNKYWNQLRESDPEVFETAKPPSELLKEHLLHLILSHHGQFDFGSPVTPKIPEAWMLHYIDNLDARMEMLRGSYAGNPELEPNLYQANRPLSGYLARPISKSFHRRDAEDTEREPE
ncbi:MAG: HD domain-containing protein [Verrucomicrobiota bacterium]